MARELHQIHSGFVVLGFAEALSAPEVTWSLVDAGFTVTAFSRKRRKSALQHSRYVSVHEITAPESDSAAAATDLAKVLSKCCPNNGAQQSVLFPLDDVALWLCAQRPLPPGWVLAGPDGNGTLLALDKVVQLTAASRAGLSVPRTTVANTRQEVLSRVGEFPLILKPAQAVVPTGNRVRKGVNWLCANRQELDRALSCWREEYRLLVQPYIAGVGVGVFGFAGPRAVEGWSAHRRLRMMNPHGSGSSACVSRQVPDGLKAPIERMILENGWHGIFMVEFLQDYSDRYWFVEVNGRPWGSMALSRRQGFEYPAWNAMLALNSAFSVEAPASNGSKVVCRNLGRELMYLAFVLRGRKSEAIREWPSFWRSAAAVLRVRKGEHFYNFRRDDPRVFFSDCLCTIRDQIFKRANRKQKA